MSIKLTSNKKLMYQLTPASFSTILLVLFISLSFHPVYAGNGNDKNNGNSENNFLNGKPFAYLYDLVVVNTDAIKSLQLESSDLAGQLLSLEGRVDSNEQSIVNALSLIVGLTSDISQLSSQLHDTELLLHNEIQQLKDDLTLLKLQANELASQLSQMSLDVADNINELEAAIAANSENIYALSTNVLLLTSRLSITEASLSTLLLRINNSEQALDSQQESLAELNAQLAELDIRVSLLEETPSAQSVEFSIEDNNSNDFEGTELRDLFAQLNVQSNDFIYIETNAPGLVNKYCAANATEYINDYLDGQDKRKYIYDQERWIDYNGSGWSLAQSVYTTVVMGNSASTHPNSWFVSSYYNFYTGFYPTRDTDLSPAYNEIYANGNRGFPTQLRIKVGTRQQACGF